MFVYYSLALACQMALKRNTKSAVKPPASPVRSATPWTFLSNHSHVLICLWRDPESRLRDVAVKVEITERAVQSIVADLEVAGALTRQRDGRRNHYKIRLDVPLRHPVESGRTIRYLLEMVGPS